MCIIPKEEIWHEHDILLFTLEYKYYNSQCIHENNLILQF